MQPIHLPTLGARYWTALCLASIFGANMGDFFARNVGLGHVAGLPFLATHPDLIVPTDEPTMRVDCGAICACLSAATGRQPVVLGKPDPAMLRDLCTRHGLEPDETAMVGDRIYTDMAMAQRAGALSVLVLSGEATAEDAAAMPTPPDMVVANVSEFGERLEHARRG